MTEKIETMRKISDWLKKYNWEVFYNQKNNDGYPKFSANSNSKPDLLIRKNNYNILIEIKPCEKHQDILNGIEQTLKYAGQYYTGRIKYKNPEKENQKLKINAFLLGTNYSMFGYLYSDESDINYLNMNYLGKNKNQTEKPISHTVTRILWRLWEKGLGIKYYENIRRGKSNNTLPLNKPKIGTLLAKTKHDSYQVSNQPYFYLNSNHFVPGGCEEIYAF